MFRAAAGPAAGDVVGLSIEAAAGIAGYAFTLGPATGGRRRRGDPRFDRSVAEATGYVPSTLLAVPLIDERGDASASSRCSTGAAARSRCATSTSPAAIARATLATRRTIGSAIAGATAHGACLRASLRELASAGTALDDDGAIDALVAAATADLADDDDHDVALADRIARLRDVDPDVGRARRSTGSMRCSVGAARPGRAREADERR